MDTSKSSKDHHSLQGWYRFAAKQSWAVDAYLRLVRMHEFKTQEQQRNEFGATPEEFLRLQAMHLPRKESFTLDARCIALSRHLQNPNIFVQKLLLAQQLAQYSHASASADQYYQAAFDPVEDLDTPDEPEKE